MVAKLVLSMDGLVLKEISLDKQRLTIGRKPYNDIQIDNLAISGEHCLIVTILDDSFLEDLNSTNGTYVNGQPIKKHVLVDREVIELGKYRLQFLKEASQAAEEAATDNVFVPTANPEQPEKESPPSLIPSGNAMAVVPEQGSVPPPQAALPLGILRVLSGANTGKELELVKAVTRLGKPGVQVVAITRRPEGYFLAHLDGACAPVVNGEPIGKQPCPLHDRADLDLAGVRMAFSIKS